VSPSGGARHMIRIMSLPLDRFHPDVLAQARELRRPAGATLFRQGQRPAWLYYVQHGEAVMQRVTPAGAPVVLQRARQGFIAEASLTAPRYHCDGVCRTDCELLAVPLAALRQAIDADAGTRWAWIDILSSQARQQRARIERQALKTIRERLHHLVMTEGSADGYEMPATKMELAADLGVTPEALYRCLAALQPEEILIVGKRLIWRQPG